MVPSAPNTLSRLLDARPQGLLKSSRSRIQPIATSEGCCHIRLRSTLRQLFRSWNHYRREPKLVFNGAREAQIAEIPANDRLVRRDSEVTT